MEQGGPDGLRSIRRPSSIPSCAVWPDTIWRASGPITRSNRPLWCTRLTCGWPISALNWKNRIHFFAISAQVMRRVLVDFARSRQRRKRGGTAQRLSLDECVNLGTRYDAGLLALDDALNTLASEDARKCQVVEMKFFGGLSTEEIAHSLHVSPDTVLRDWKLAKLWLLREMGAKKT